MGRNLNSVIFLGASSSLGKMFINLAKDRGIECLAIVRGKENLQMMKDEFKMKMVLNLEESSFKNQFCEMREKMMPMLMIDAIGGDLAGNLFSMMPQKSEMISVGNLSN